MYRFNRKNTEGAPKRYIIDNKNLKINYDLQKVEKEIANLPFVVYSNIIQEAEFFHMPDFLFIFYKCIFDYNRIPTLNFLLKEYFNFYKEQLGSLSNYMKHGFTCRLSRSYPSLVRDFHFYFLCLNSNLFERVVYSTDWDKKGIDVLAFKDNQWIGIRLYLNSKRSLLFNKRKKEKVKYLNIKVIDIPLQKYKKIGYYYLYTEEYIKNI